MPRPRHEHPTPAELEVLKILWQEGPCTVRQVMNVLNRQRRFPRGTWLLVSWAGLRGGISVAMALSLAPGRERTLIVSITYVIVVFTVLAQGLSLPRVIRLLEGRRG